MGQLTQPVSTEAHPVRRARSAWRFVPVALGTAAVLAGCGASGHGAARVAGVSAHQHTVVSHRALGVAAVSSAHKHRAHSHHARRAAVLSAHKHRALSHHAVPSAHQHPTTARAAATGQTAVPPAADTVPGNVVPGAGAPNGAVTVGGSSAKHSGAGVGTATPRPTAGPRIFTGTGNANIGSLAERTSVSLVWTASEGPIQIFTSHGNLLLSSHARNGTIRLTEGQYPGLRVASPGAWTLRLGAAA
jgi:hypothetical protein